MENQMTKKEITAKMAALCSRSEQCSPEMRKKIKAAGLNEEEAGEIIEELKKEKFIDDQRYISAYISEKFRINQWGKVKMRYYLRMKGLEDALIQKGLDEMDETKYHEILKTILKKKARTIKKKNKYEKMGQVIRFAQNRGFEPELIHRYLNEVLD